MSNPSARKTIAFPFHALSVVAMLGCDWFIYLGNMATHMEAVTAWVLTGSVAAGILTVLAEREIGGASRLASALRAAAAGLLVAAPLPLLGTLLAAVAMLWALGSLLFRSEAQRAPSGVRA
jgi:hypothetical protein